MRSPGRRSMVRYRDATEAICWKVPVGVSRRQTMYWPASVTLRWSGWARVARYQVFTSGLTEPAPAVHAVSADVGPHPELTGFTRTSQSSLWLYDVKGSLTTVSSRVSLMNRLITGTLVCHAKPELCTVMAPATLVHANRSEEQCLRCGQKHTSYLLEVAVAEMRRPVKTTESRVADEGALPQTENRGSATSPWSVLITRSTAPHATPDTASGTATLQLAPSGTILNRWFQYTRCPTRSTALPKRLVAATCRANGSCPVTTAVDRGMNRAEASTSPRVKLRARWPISPPTQSFRPVPLGTP
mmetsp:Transcript_25195/g.64469  ORF Transcript_25195/g.64469 Transcript_25195/m.64469 type:complete len:301 (+) Transcript_25195:4007-4909(+)